MLLDLVRFGAAIAVAVGHLSGDPFSTRWPYLLNVAVGAVAVFFVLSGFVIRLTTKVRSTTPSAYAVDRISRIYSVVLPALLFTILVALCLHSFPTSRVNEVVFAPRVIGLQFLENVTFTGALWGLDVPMSFNGVFWSLCYEWAYYCFYGLAFFGKRPWRLVSLCALALIVGPPILFMLPLWLFGCLIHDLFQRLRGRDGALMHLSVVLVSLGLLTVALHTLLRTMGHGLHRIVVELAPSQLLQWPRQHHLHLLQRASLHAYIVGVPAGILILWLLLLLEYVSIHRDNPAMRIVRVVADGTFTLYLIHIPLLMLIYAYVPYDRGNAAQKLLVLAAIVVISVTAAIPLDSLKRALRRILAVSREASTV